MVSMADEQGRLVLMGVDATYCVVDEVDTTTSTMHDHFLQQAIEDAEGTVKQEPHDSDDDTADTNTQTQRPAGTHQPTQPTPTPTEEWSSGAATDRAKLPAGPVSVAVEPGATQVKKPMTNSSVLRAVLLRLPVSLREPGAGGQRDLLPKNITLVDSLSPHLFSPMGQASPPGQASSTAKPKPKRKLQSKTVTVKGGSLVIVNALSQSDTKNSPASSPPPSSEVGEKDVDGENSGAEEEKGEGEGGLQQPGREKRDRSKRPREKPYQCGVCQRWFGCKSHVVEHMRTHTGEKPFECSLCHKRFSQKSNIYQHMNTHTQERPFRCTDCGKDFMYRGSLYKHKRLHTGERPYTCGMCQRRFTHASQLFEHLRTHTNERPFKCGVCGRAFAHSGTMHRHQRNHFSQIKKRGHKGQVQVKDTTECEDGDERKEAVGDINHNSESYTMDWASGKTQEAGDASGMKSADPVSSPKDGDLSELTSSITPLLDRALTEATRGQACEDTPAVSNTASPPPKDSALLHGGHGESTSSAPQQSASISVPQQNASSSSPQRSASNTPPHSPAQPAVTSSDPHHQAPSKGLQQESLPPGGSGVVPTSILEAQLKATREVPAKRQSSTHSDQATPTPLSLSNQDRPKTINQPTPPSEQGKPTSPGNEGKPRSPDSNNQGKPKTPSTQGKAKTPSDQGKAKTPSAQGKAKTPNGQGKSKTPNGQGKSKTPNGQGKSKTPCEQVKSKTPNDQGKAKRTRLETDDRKVFSCNVCGHSFCHKRSVKRHKLAVHPDSKDDGVILCKLDLSQDAVVKDDKDDVAMEDNNNNNNVAYTPLSDSHVLKSLLALTSDRGTSEQGEGRDKVPDLAVAALDVGPLGEASASLQAIAQICSQGPEGEETETPSPPSSPPPTPTQGRAAGKRSKPRPSRAAKTPKLCVKVDRKGKVSRVKAALSTGAAKGTTPGEGVEGEADSTDSPAALHSVVVKLEAPEDFLL